MSGSGPSGFGRADLLMAQVLEAAPAERAALLRRMESESPDLAPLLRAGLWAAGHWPIFAGLGRQAGDSESPQDRDGRR